MGSPFFAQLGWKEGCCFGRLAPGKPFAHLGEPSEVLSSFASSKGVLTAEEELCCFNLPYKWRSLHARSYHT